MEEENREAQSVISNMTKNDKSTQKTIERMKNKLKILQAKNFEEEQKSRLLYQKAMQGASIKGWKKAEQQAFLDYYARIDVEYLLLLDDYDSLSTREKMFLVLQHEGKEEETLKEMMGLSATNLRVIKSRIKNKQ